MRGQRFKGGSDELDREGHARAGKRTLTEKLAGPEATRSGGAAQRGVAERHERLDSSQAARFGTKLGADFSGVNIHHGDGVAEDHGAAAITFLNQIHFAGSAVRGNGSDDALLGHELVHTVQQGAVPTHGAAPSRDGDTANTEAEAEALGRGAARGEAGAVTLRAPSSAQRKPEPRPAGGDTGSTAPAEQELAAAIAHGPKGAAPGSAPVAGGGAPAASTPIGGGSAPAEAAPAASPAPPAPQASAAPPASTTAPASAPPSSLPAPSAAAGPPPDAPPPSSPKAPAAASSPPPPKPPGATPPPPPRPPAPAHPAAGAVHPATSPGISAAPAAPRPSAPRTPAAPAARLAAPPATSADHQASAALGSALLGEGHQLAARLRSRAAAVATSIRGRGQQGAAQITGAHAATSAQMASQLAASQGAIAAGQAGASTAIASGHAAAAATVHGAGEAQATHVQAAAQTQKAQGPAAAEQAKGQVSTAAQGEAARFQQGSAARTAQAQAPVGGGGEGEIGSAQGQANDKAAAQAQQNFAKDDAAAQASTAQASTEATGWLTSQASSFVSQIDQALPQMIGGITSHVAAATAGMSHAASEGTGAVHALGSGAAADMATGHAAATADIASHAAAMSSALGRHAEDTAAEIERQAEQLAAAIEQQAAAAAAAISAVPLEHAQQMAAEARAELAEAGSQADAQLAGLESRVTSALDQHAAQGAGGITAAGQAAGGHMQQGAQAVGNRLVQAGAKAQSGFAHAAGTVTGQLQQGAAQAAEALGQGGTQFGTAMGQAGGAARTAIAQKIDQASSDQQANLGVVQAKKASASGEVVSTHASLKADADAKNASSDDSGQKFLDFLIPKAWKDWVKNLFQNSFLRFVTGLLYGIVTALVGLVICIGIIALAGFLFGPIGALVALGALLFVGAAFGTYSRFTGFQAANGRDPTLGEGICLYLLGIADITGVPQIVEGIVGYKAFQMHNPDGTLRPKMDWFDRGEGIGSGIVQVIAIIFGLRGAKGVPDVKTPDIKPPDVKPPDPVPDPDPNPNPNPKPPGPDPKPPGPDPKPPGPDPKPPGPDPKPPEPDPKPPGPDPKPPGPDPKPPGPDPKPPGPDPKPPGPDPKPPGPDPKPPGPDPKPPGPKPNETPPPRDADGKFDFDGRDAKALKRDCDHKPYDGESQPDADARAKAAQQEVVKRIENMQPCFVAGTMVLTPDGPFPIEDIRVGTRVIAADPDVPGSTRGYQVLALYRGVTDRLRHVEVAGQTITATLNHRFYVVEHGWVAARQLEVGDRLVTAGGDTAAITAVRDEHLDHDVATFNMHVAEVSTYFVGAELPVLVHNANPKFDGKLWWLFGKEASFRPTDTDGLSMWQTNSEQDVIDMFKIRRNIDGRSSSDPHKAYTEADLAAKGIKVEETPGNGTMAGRLQHGSARPAAPEPGDLAPTPDDPTALSEAGIHKAVDGINAANVTEKATPKSMGCK